MLVAAGGVPAQLAQDVLAEHRGGGDQRAAGGRHHRGEGGGEHQARQQRGQRRLDDVRERVVGGVEIGQQHLGRHPDHRAGHAVEQAVDACRGARPAGDAGAARGEHPLPDVLADEQAEGVDHEVGEDRAAADRGERERVHGQRRLQARRSHPRVLSTIGSRRKKIADRLDHELDEVGERDRPHAAERRVDDDHGAAQQDRGHLAQVEQHGEDRRVGDGRGDRRASACRPTSRRRRARSSPGRSAARASGRRCRRSAAGSGRRTRG